MAVELDSGHAHRLEHEKERLRGAFRGTVPPDVLNRTIEETAAAFEGARIREYVPVLVHRTVHAVLRTYLSAARPGL